MWIKLLGGIAVLAGAWILGKNMSDRLKKRVMSLKAFHSALVLLEGEISFSQNSIDRAFKNISGMVLDEGFFMEVADNVNKIGVRSAWKEGLLKYKDKLGISDDDREILLSLGAELGVTDRENQIKNIRYVLSMLEGAENRAEEQYSSLSGLYRKISLGTGLAVVILLM